MGNKGLKFVPLGMLLLGLAAACLPGIRVFLLLPGILAALCTALAQGAEGSGEAELPSVPGAFGQFFLGGCIGATMLLSQPVMSGAFGVLWKTLGWLACGGAVLGGFLRFQGKKPSFFLYLLICGFVMIHIVMHYQSWSSCPQVMDYLFQLLGAASLVFFAYYKMAAAVNLGRASMERLMGLLSIFLSIGAIPGCAYPLLYLGGALWSLTNLGKLGADA